jgi:hypothetical protein
MDRVQLVSKNSALAAPRGFLDADQALAMLTQAAQDRGNLQHFRQVWADAALGGGVYPPTDRTVLQFLAGRLVSGVLRVALKARPDPNPVRRILGGTPVAPPPPPPEMRPPPVAGPLKLRPRLPTLPAEVAPLMDAAAQVESLLNAAKAGVPFCEQCAKLLT